MKQEELQNLQQELDVNKWADGQVKGSDPCGSYDYCVKCDKAVAYPCATAKTAFETPVAKKETKKSAPRAKSVKAPVAEVKAEAKPEVKAEVKVEAKPEVKAEVKEVKAEVKEVKAPAKKGKKCR